MASKADELEGLEELSNDPVGDVPTAAPAKRKSSSGSKRGPKSKADRLDEVEGMLRDQLSAVAPLMMLPTAAQVWTDKSEQAVRNLVVLARRYPSLLNGLESGVVVFAAVGLVNFSSSVGYAAACDLGFADPYSPAARMMGVESAWEITHEEEERDDHGPRAPAAAGSGEGTPESNGQPAARRRGAPVPAVMASVLPSVPPDVGAVS